MEERRMEIGTICLNSKGGRGGIQGLQPSLQDRVYDPSGVSYAMTTGFQPSILTIGRMDHTRDHTLESANRVYLREGLVPTIPSIPGGDHIPKIIDVKCVAMRGRGENNNQQLEPRKDKCTNALTSASKDNLVLTLGADERCLSRAEQSRAEQSRWLLNPSGYEGWSDILPSARRCGSELSNEPYKERKSDRERKCSSDTNNGEYP